MARMTDAPEREDAGRLGEDERGDTGGAVELSDDPGATGRRRRLALFAALCAVCLAVAAMYTIHAAGHGTQAPQAAAGLATDRDAIAAQPRLLFAESGGNPLADDPLAMAPLAAPDADRYHAGFTCQRVYFTAGEGLCLTLGHDASAAKAFIFDGNFKVLHTLSPIGLPSRARISSDGRYGSMTLFVSGDSYAAGNQFSTRTSIIDMQSGNVAANLEDFTVHRDGQVFHLADFNFWGVTFAKDSNQFYATLGTSGKTYLVAGDIAAREMHTLVENVECPSLSPDNRHLVFKKRIADGPPTIWRLTVLDLATMQQKPLAETRSVDDQAEWLDNNHVLYSPTTQKPAVWSVPADGSGQPQLFASGVVSPSVVH
jgi:hypothetical protein